MNTFVLSGVVTIVVLFAYHYGKFKAMEKIFLFVEDEGDIIIKDIDSKSKKEKDEKTPKEQITYIQNLSELSGRLKSINDIMEKILSITSFKEKLKEKEKLEE